MKTATLSSERADLVRRRALEGVAEVLRRGDDLTYANVAAAAGIAERTLYRHFPTREDLLAAVYAWANEQLGFRGTYPTDEAGLIALVRCAFPGFDALAPVINQLLIAPEGRLARLANKRSRQAGALALVHHEAPGLDPESERRLAALLSTLTAAATWQSLRDYWDMDGTEAAETAALATRLLLEAARARRKRAPSTNQTRAARKKAQ
jgi:AcrR family transcriptional regulator